MKKTKFKIFTIITFVFLLLGILQTNTNAAGSFDVTCSATSVYVGDTITITVKATNAAGMYQVNASNSNVSLTSGNTNEFIENTSTTIKYKATKAGSVTITATASDLTDLDDSTKKVTGSKSFNITIKDKSTSSSLSENTGNSGSGGHSNSSSSSNNTTTKTPTFTSANKTVYTTGSCNLRASWSTSSTAIPVEKGTELKLTGTSTESIDGYVWYRVTYNGTTKYIASSLITETKPKEEDKEKSSNKNLSSLSIDGIELTPAFSKDTTQYTAKVDGDVTELKISAKAEDSKAKVTVEGNEGLKEGDNVIKVKVTAEDDTTRTYFITVTVGEGTEVDNTLKLSDLKIEKVNFEENFNPDTYTYRLSLNTYVDKLVITAIPNKADATVEIIGNSDFVVGTNTVTILLTSADGTQTATYQIQVDLPEEAIEEKSELSTSAYIIIGVVIAVIIILIVWFISRCRTRKKEEIIEDEDINSKLMSRYTAYDEQKEEEKETSKRKKVDVAVDDFSDESDEKQGKPKKPNGRHSM